MGGCVLLGAEITFTKNKMSPHEKYEHSVSNA